jgi:putative chitinase
MSDLITAAQMRLFAPSCDYLAVGPGLNRACKAHGIDTPRRVRHFLAQCHVESMGFTRLEENLNYSAERMTVVWPKRFPTVASAKPFAHDPKALANKVYGSRFGNNQVGDGWRFRGRAFNGITFRSNYGRAQAWSGLPLVEQPELAAQIGPAAEIAASYWEVEGFNAIVDQDPDEKIIADLTLRIVTNETDDVDEAGAHLNGGETGRKARRDQLLRAAAIWI